MTTPSMRFGISSNLSRHLGELTERARWAESVGFSVFAVADHLNAMSPFVQLQAVAAVTSSIGLGTLVINNDFRSPAILAQDAATVDVLSGGRLELGLGAGWAVDEYRRGGIPFDAPSTRIERLAETVRAVRELRAGPPVTTDGPHVRLDGHIVVPRFRQGEGLPLLVGGNGDKVLTVAAELADIVGFTGFSFNRDGTSRQTHFSWDGLAERIDFVRQAAGPRADQLELNLLVQHLSVTDDARGEAEELASHLSAWSPDEVLASPFIAVGSVEAICEKLTALRDELGIGYVTVFDARSVGVDEVLEAMSQQ